jgi:hypothetical protein
MTIPKVIPVRNEKSSYRTGITDSAPQKQDAKVHHIYF